MLTRCHYTNDFKSVYIDDYIATLDKLPEKNFVIIYHNVPEIKGLSFYYNSIFNLSLSKYKTIYTSEPYTVYYEPLDSSRSCDSKFPIDKINSIINIACVRTDILYVIFLITPNPIDPINLMDLTNPNIHLVNLNQLNPSFNLDLLIKYKIKIIDTNISKEVIGLTYEIEDMLKPIIFIKSSRLPNFLNWIKYTIEDFEKLVICEELVAQTKPDIEKQIIGLKNIMCEDNFSITKTKFLHTINYYNSFVSQYQKSKLSELISSTNVQFSMIQNNNICENLTQTNQADSLFSKSLKITTPFITWKQSKTFASNKIKTKRINIKINPIDQMIKTNPHFIKSIDEYTSSISLSNWYEEYENNSCMGLLINIQTEYPDRMGWTTDTINVKVTNTLIGRDQIYDGHEFFWNQNYCLDNGKMETNLISGTGIGSGNTLLPLYINKFHWDIAKNFLEEQISIGITQNPYLFKPIMLGIYSHVLIKIISDIVTSGCSNPLIKTLIWVGLTIKKLDQIYLSSTNQDIRVYLSDYFFKWLDGTDCGSQMSKKQIFKIYENITRYNMKDDFRTKKDIQFLSPVDILNTSVNKPNITDFENFVIFTNLPINKYISNLIKQADESYGCIDDISPDLIELKNTIKSNEKFFKFKDMFGKLEFDQAIQVFTYQCFLSRTPKLKSRLESTIGLIDFTCENLTDQMILTQLIKLNGIIG